MKSNDNIPTDEMLLAEAIAAAKARGLGWTSLRLFRDAMGHETTPEQATQCCALGALVLAGAVTHEQAHRIEQHADFNVSGSKLALAYEGNDRAHRWRYDDADKGESLGWAFRCAMTQEDDERAAVAEGGV